MQNSVTMFYVLSFLCCVFIGGASGAPLQEDNLNTLVIFSRFEVALFFLLVFLGSYTRHTSAYVVFKALPIFFLIYKSMGMSSHWIFYGLVFGVMGDISLLFYKRVRSLLILGGVFFLLGHGSYLVAYAKAPLSMGKELWVSWLGLFLIFMHEYFYFMKKHARFPEFLFGVLYWTAISLMLVAAANTQHYLWYRDAGFPYAFLGSFLFVMSDLCIHIVLYVSNHKLADRMILPLYYVAQLMIVLSAHSLDTIQ